MTRTEDPFTRFEAADPVAMPEHATPEEEREVALLLERVIATAVQEESTPPRPVRRRGRRRVFVGVAAAASLAVALALVLSPAQRSLADRAYAAVTAPDLFHVVSRSTSDVPDLNAPAGERREKSTGETESWYDTGEPAFHTVIAFKGNREGRFAREAAGDENGTVARIDGGPASGVAELDEDGRTREVFPKRFDPTAETKAFLREPGVREDGEVTIDGRRARRLVITRPDQPDAGASVAIVDTTATVLVDAKTLYPIEYREQSFFVRDGVRERFAMVIRYTTFEKLPRTAGNLRLLKMGARP